jgi:hypothetical protein
MTTDRPLRASDILGRTATDRDGKPLGRIVDLICEPHPDDGAPTITAALVVNGPWGRLLGYEREQVAGPRLIETLARHILRHTQTTIPWTDLHLADTISHT